MEINIIHCGDCLEVMKKFPDESINLIYLDPPFFSQKHYENFWIKDKASKLGFSDKDWGKLRDSINPTLLKEYEEIEKRWKGGHKGIYVYIAYMRERLEQCWRILKPTGSIYLHCDWHAGHYLKVMMDEVFGYNNFRNEVIWHYFMGGKAQSFFARKHDDILFYTKSNKWTFNSMKHKRRLDFKPTLKDESKDAQVGKDEYGYYSVVTLDDVWDIKGVFNMSKEYLGYPTQKPEELLDRIIKASSNEGDIALDPFCDCGTTLIASKKLNRKWIGIDISRTACDVMKKRVGGKVIGGESEEELRNMNPHDFARLIIVEKLNGTINPRKSGDMGIDGWVDFMATPVQVKNLGHKVGRPEIDKFLTAVRRIIKRKER